MFSSMAVGLRVLLLLQDTCLCAEYQYLYKLIFNNAAVRLPLPHSTLSAPV